MEPEVYDSVYQFLVSTGHASTAKSLLKEAKLDEKKVRDEDWYVHV